MTVCTPKISTTFAVPNLYLNKGRSGLRFEEIMNGGLDFHFKQLTSRPKFLFLGTCEIVFDMCKQQRADNIQTKMITTLIYDEPKNINA